MSVPRRLARSLVAKLPAPRDQAAADLVRSARALVRGTPAAGPQPTQPAPKRKRAGHSEGVPGRWLRVLGEARPGPVVTDREPADPGEAAAVRAGWLLIDAHERLSVRGAQRVFGHELDAWQRYADESIAPMVAIDVSAKTWHVEESAATRMRYRRTIDFAHPGDRVFDVGFGRGYLAAVLLRDRQVASYSGIELLDGKVDVARQLFAANGLDDSTVYLEQGDLFDLTRGQTGDADLVICCEVLEHVPDAEKAVRILADSLPEGADLLFSVPLAGRLESVWGHVSVFDVARIKGMLDGAGLVAHHVQPLANTWTVVVASKSPEPSERVAKALTRPPERVSVPLVAHRGFVDVPAATIAGTGLGAVVTPGPEAIATTGLEAPPKLIGETVLLEVTGGGGLTAPISGLEAARLKVTWVDVAHVRRIVLRGLVGGTEVCRWTWTPSAGELGNPQQRRSFRPGESSATVVAGEHRRLAEVDRLDVLVEQPADASARLWVAVAYLP